MAAPITSWLIRSAFSNNACMTKTSTEANEDNEEGMELQDPPQGPHHQVHHSPSPQKRGRCHQLDCNHSALSNRVHHAVLLILFVSFVCFCSIVLIRTAAPRSDRGGWRGGRGRSRRRC